MGFFDRAKAVLGWPSDESLASRVESKRAKDKSGRPPLKDLPAASPAATLDDVFAAREAGHKDQARSILAAIDRGKRLRTVLRAAAALEAHDEMELKTLLPAIAQAEPRWILALQIAAALGPQNTNAADVSLLVTYATAHGAPDWALAWVAASSGTEEARRQGRVDLLFCDAPLARTVAARDWRVTGAVDDHEAIERYASFAHGRDAIQRFGAAEVLPIWRRAHGEP